MTLEFAPGVIPPQLVTYWTKGEGAARIRWGEGGDFNRCVRELRSEGVDEKYLKGECNKLHRIALGVAPGQEHSLEFAAQTHTGAIMEALVASMGTYTPVMWEGPLAPIGKPTGDRRIFPAGVLSFPSFPAPLRWQEKGMPGHESAVVVAAITHAEEGTWEGQPHIIGRGYFLNPAIIPDVEKAIHLVQNGVAGPSVDLDTFTGQAIEYGGKTMLAVREGRVRAATLVSIPAFADLRLQLDYPQAVDEPVDESDITDLVEPEADTSDPLGELMEPVGAELDPAVAAGMDAWEAEFASASVNATGWHGAPIAPREAEFDADDAVARIEDYAGLGGDSPDESKMRKMFLWVDPQGAPLDRSGYRLPWGDIIDGKPYLIYHAIYAASALLEGGHGGLPNIPDADKARLRSVISEIYAKLATEFGDPNIQASWDRAAEKADNATKAAADDVETFSGKYTEKLHPRDYHGRWSDVPGHGPHGEITKGHGGGGDSGSKESKPGKPHGDHPSVGASDDRTDKAWNTKAKAANHGSEALDSAPAKLTRASAGHSGKYGDEALDAPDGAGSARALAEMEGTEYEATNSALWSGDLSASQKERVAEVDKTMKVSKLPKDTVVYRGTKDGQRMFGTEWWGRGFDSKSMEEQDKLYEAFQNGDRPDLTGLEWTQKSYLHSTVDSERLAGYAAKSEIHEPVAMTILLPKGTGAIRMSDMDYEAELMAQRGLRLRVVADHGYDKHGVRHLDIEVVGHES